MSDDCETLELVKTKIKVLKTIKRLLSFATKSNFIATDVTYKLINISNFYNIKFFNF